LDTELIKFALPRNYIYQDDNQKELL